MEATKVFKQFQEIWKAGKDARLNFECHAGQVWLHLQVHLPQPPLPQPYHHPQAPRQGPSRLRRHARRSEARAKAAEKAVNQTVTVEVSVQTIEKEVKTTDAAVQAAFEDQPAKLYNHTPHLSFPFPPPHIPDEFYSEQENEAAAQAEAQAQYAATHIPQVDGLDDATVIAGQDHIWSCKCCMFQKFFDTEEELQQHHNGLDDRGDQHFISYEECNICYPWHVWS